MVIPPPPAAETAKLMSPLAVAESDKDTVNAAKAPVGAAVKNAMAVVLNAGVNTEVNAEESSEGEEVDEGREESGQDKIKKKEPKSDADDGSDDDDAYNPNRNVFDDEDEEELDKKCPAR